MITWTKYNGEKLSTGKKLVQRKDGKIHFEMYNGSGFAYNQKVIVAYSEINKWENPKVKPVELFHYEDSKLTFNELSDRLLEDTGQRVSYRYALEYLLVKN